MVRPYWVKTKQKGDFLRLLDIWNSATPAISKFPLELTACYMVTFENTSDINMK